MRIGIKVSPLTVLKAGIPNYILNLLQALSVEDRENSYFLYTNRLLPEGLGLPQRFRVVRVRFPAPGLQLWYQIGLPLRMKRDLLDVFHDPVYPLPLYLPVPGVITVHDLSAYTRPDVHSLRSSLAARLYPRHLRRARRIMADSRYTASEIERLFPEEAGKVEVVHLGVSDRFRRVADAERLEAVSCEYGLPERFILFLGTMEPRKNLAGLLSAFEAAGGDIPQSLVIAGGRGWKYGKVLETMSRHRYSERIVQTGFIRQEDLPAVLSLADFLVYPSLLEGFGLPVLEAMACGTPVLTSNGSSLSEVAGDAALLVDPCSVESIAEGLLRLGTDGDLRAELAGRGPGRASLFSWESTARKTLSVYESVQN